MASITSYGRGYRAQVYVRGVRDSKTFRTRREADAWAAARETEIRAGAEKRPSAKFTLADGLRKYSQEVSPSKRGCRWEQIRIAAIIEQHRIPTDLPIGEVGADHLAAWRDDRLRCVSAGTVLREIAILSAFFELARREWKWIDANPIEDLKKPRTPDHRDTIIRWGQIRRMLRAMSWAPGPCKSATQAAGRAFMLALLTGMRAGELCSLAWVQVGDNSCHLPVTKTKRRTVPLEWRARKLIDSMRGWDSATVFGISAQTLDAIFRRCRARAGLSGFTFHDARHTAATRIARRLDVLDLCKMFGWSNPRQAMAYYNPTAGEIASRLRPRPGQQGRDRSR